VTEFDRHRGIALSYALSSRSSYPFAIVIITARWNDVHSQFPFCHRITVRITATDNAQTMQESGCAHTMALHNININIVETTWIQNKLKLRDPFSGITVRFMKRLHGKCKILVRNAKCNYSASLHIDRVALSPVSRGYWMHLAFREISSNLAREWFVRWD